MYCWPAQQEIETGSHPHGKRIDAMRGREIENLTQNTQTNDFDRDVAHFMPSVLIAGDITDDMFIDFCWCS